MIITKIIGGLGNQMFCYAAGKALAARLNVPFKIDISAYAAYKLHGGYTLNNFNISTDIANPKDFVLKNQASLFQKLRLCFQRNAERMFLYSERGMGFDENLLNSEDQTYLSGYWQSEQYFQGIEDSLRKDFTFAESPNQINADFLKRIRSDHSISVHIRRGDYISNPNANAVHGTCDLDYYQQAAELLLSKFNATPFKFYVFSDDVEWVKSNLKLNSEMIFVDHNNGEKNHEDLRLMSACQHHIIANSTFSWWGAWLNQSKDKVVIAPKQWFKHPDYINRDLIPSSWISI